MLQIIFSRNILFFYTLNYVKQWRITISESGRQVANFNQLQICSAPSANVCHQCGMLHQLFLYPIGIPCHLLGLLPVCVIHLLVCMSAHLYLQSKVKHPIFFKQLLIVYSFNGCAYKLYLPLNKKPKEDRHWFPQSQKERKIRHLSNLSQFYALPQT